MSLVPSLITRFGWPAGVLCKPTMQVARAWRQFPVVRTDSPKTAVQLQVFFLWPVTYFPSTIGSMYGIFAYLYHKDQPDVGKYLWELTWCFHIIRCLQLHGPSPELGKVRDVQILRQLGHLMVLRFLENGALNFWMMECTPPKTHMTMEKRPFEDVSQLYLLSKMVMFYCHVSFRGCM